MLFRFRNLLVAAIVIVSPSLAAAQSVAVAAPPDLIPMPNALYGKGYRLVKDWDFGVNIQRRLQMDGEFFTRYVYDNGRTDTLSGNHEWERYSDNDNHRFEGGTLNLMAHVRRGLKDGGIESGMLRSRWTGKYGYFECRMKAPNARGTWPAFWLNPQDGRWPPEIDILEIVNNERESTKNSFHFLHPGKADTSQTLSTKLDQWGAYRPPFDYKDDFHTFAVEWTPEKVTHYVDEVMVAERTFKWKHDDGSDGGPAHVLLNLAVGGDWPGAPQRAEDFPAALEVDFIRVWQKAPLATR